MKSLMLHIVATIIAIATLLPFVWMVSASFMPSGASLAAPPPLIPQQVTLTHYIKLFQQLNLGRYFLNSFVLAVSVTLLSVLVNSLAGFAFAKYAFPGRRRLFVFLIASMIVPGQVTMLPVFFLLNRLGLLNTYFGVILPGMASVFGIFLIEQYMRSIPDSLLESARIDGASEFWIYRHIIVPLARPVLVTLALFTFMGSWNDFLWPLIVMSKQEMYTLPVALANLAREHVPDTELMMAGSVLTVLPVVLVFLILQRHYIQGLMLGGLKE